MWHVVSIRAQRHKSILEKMEALDITTYHPQRTVWRKMRNGGREPRNYPLIPGYLFVGVDLNVVSARSILSIAGVLSFLSVEGRPSAVNEDELDRIRDSETRGAYDETARRVRELLVGQTMTIATGPFGHYSGVVSSVDGPIVHLDITMFGKTTTIKIDVDNLD